MEKIIIASDIGGSKETIIEVFKKNIIENKNIRDNDNLDYEFKKNNILKFY